MSCPSSFLARLRMRFSEIDDGFSPPIRRYRTLIDRVLKMRLVYARRAFTPNVSFEFLNRQLVWEAFTVRSVSVTLPSLSIPSDK